MEIHKDKTIFIVDDDREFAQSLAVLLESVNLKVKTFGSAMEYLAYHDHSHQGCLLIDVRMPVMSGLELLEKLNAKRNMIPAIIMTGFGDIAMAVKAMKTGAVEFLVKPFNDQDLLEVIYSHLNEANIKEKLGISSQRNILTKREKQVIELILEGKFNKEIADELKISNSTVEAHRSRIMRKFQAKNAVELIKKYYCITIS